MPILKITNLDGNSIDYAVKLHRGKWYVYLSKDDRKFIRRHGPFSAQQPAVDFIYGIRDEIKDAISKAGKTYTSPEKA